MIGHAVPVTLRGSPQARLAPCIKESPRRRRMAVAVAEGSPAAPWAAKPVPEQGAPSAGFCHPEQSLGPHCEPACARTGAWNRCSSASMFRRIGWTFTCGLRTESLRGRARRRGLGRAGRASAARSMPRLVVLEATGGFESTVAAALAAGGTAAGGRQSAANPRLRPRHRPAWPRPMRSMPRSSPASPRQVRPEPRPVRRRAGSRARRTGRTPAANHRDDDGRAQSPASVDQPAPDQGRRTPAGGAAEGAQRDRTRYRRRHPRHARPGASATNCCARVPGIGNVDRPHPDRRAARTRITSTASRSPPSSEWLHSIATAAPCAADAPPGGGRAKVRSALYMSRACRQSGTSSLLAAFYQRLVLRRKSRRSSPSSPVMRKLAHNPQRHDPGQHTMAKRLTNKTVAQGDGESYAQPGVFIRQYCSE